ATQGNPQTILQTIVTGNYTTTAGDAGKQLTAETPDSPVVVTIAGLSLTDYPIGTTFLFINLMPISTMTVTLAGAFNLRQALTDIRGARVIAPFGSATVIKVNSTDWYINGVGLS